MNCCVRCTVLVTFVSKYLMQINEPALIDSKFPWCRNFQWSAWNLIPIQVHSYVFMCDTVWDQGILNWMYSNVDITQENYIRWKSYAASLCSSCGCIGPQDKIYRFHVIMRLKTSKHFDLNMSIFWMIINHAITL